MNSSFSSDSDTPNNNSKTDTKQEMDNSDDNSNSGNSQALRRSTRRKAVLESSSSGTCSQSNSSQTITDEQHGSFTYYHVSLNSGFMDPDDAVVDQSSKQKLLSKSKSFFLSLTNIKTNYKLLVETMEMSFDYFTWPQASAVSFLREFMNYPIKQQPQDKSSTPTKTSPMSKSTKQEQFRKTWTNLSISSPTVAGTFFPDTSLYEQLELYETYLLFMNNLFIDKFLVENCWSKNDLLELFRANNTNLPKHDFCFLFNLIEYEINRFHNLIIKDPDRSSNQSNEANYLNTGTEFLSIMVQFLEKDFQIFLRTCEDYVLDIVERPPILVGLFWEQSNLIQKKFQYCNSCIKYFITLLCQALRLFQDVSKNRIQDQLLELYRSMFHLLCLLSETHRITTGNIRPYLHWTMFYGFTKHRRTIQQEFIYQLIKQDFLLNNFDLIEFILDSLREHAPSWLTLEMSMLILLKQFQIDFKSRIESKYRSGKIGSLKTILQCFLPDDGFHLKITGDGDQARALHLYFRMVNHIIKDYLQIIQFKKFEMITILDDIDDDHLWQQFQQIFKRQPNDQDIDHLVDDIETLKSFSRTIQQFFTKLTQSDDDSVNYVSPLEFKDVEHFIHSKIGFFE